MSSSEAAGNAARSVASTVATSVGASLAKHGVSMAREVPGTVAVFAGIAGFGMYMYTCRYICTCAYGVWYVRVWCQMFRMLQLRIRSSHPRALL